MLQRKPNPELAQAHIDNQPPSVIYRPHPKKKGIMQRFHPTFTLDAEANRIIHLGKSDANFRPCEPGEKYDTMIYSHDDLIVKGYVKC